MQILFIVTDTSSINDLELDCMYYLCVPLLSYVLSVCIKPLMEYFAKTQFGLVLCRSCFGRMYIGCATSLYYLAWSICTICIGYLSLELPFIDPIDVPATIQIFPFCNP